MAIDGTISARRGAYPSDQESSLEQGYTIGGARQKMSDDPVEVTKSTVSSAKLSRWLGI
ncbi:MAG: hypothetical protein Ct9H300mP22_1240 [Gammaproteobacteria bacterium]|nr:MAG: hypothetical protein Ct9H300mP22_1240 [Gammaproteobacteria bacterium]